MISSLLKVLNILILCWKINQNSKIHQSRIVSIDQLYHQQMIFKKSFWSMKQISLYTTKNVLVLVILSWILRVLNILILCWKINKKSIIAILFTLTNSIINKQSSKKCFWNMKQILLYTTKEVLSFSNDVFTS
jgi:hypothetical protein